jgi:hypothetical protein
VIAELEPVALTKDVPEYRLVTGDIGTVVHLYAGGDAAEVEFVRADGHTIAVLTLQSSDFRPLQADVLHARRLVS